jgi:hypothetical protein
MAPTFSDHVTFKSWLVFLGVYTISTHAKSQRTLKFAHYVDVRASPLTPPQGTSSSAKSTAHNHAADSSRLTPYS